MNSASKHKKDNKKNESLAMSLLRIVLAVYFFLLLMVMPFISEQSFGDIGSVKNAFFQVISYHASLKEDGMVLFYFPGFLTIALVLWVCDAVACYRMGVDHEGTPVFLEKCPEGKNKILFFLNRVAKYLRKGLSVLDWFVLAFAVLAVLSTLLAPDKSVVLYGYPGWDIGLFSELSCVVIYFLVSRILTDDKMVRFLLIGGAAVACAVGFIGIQNRLGVDPFGLYAAVGWVDVAGSSTGFVSTIGNRGWYATYLIIWLSVPMYLLWRRYERVKNDKTKILQLFDLERLFGVVGTMILFTALVVSDAESAILGLMAIFIVFFLFSFLEKEQPLRFLEVLLASVGGMLCFKIVSTLIMGGAMTFTSGLSARLLTGNGVLICFVVLTIVWIWVRFLSRRLNPSQKAESNLSGKKNEGNEQLRKIGRVICILIVATIIVVILYMLANSYGLLPKSLSSSNEYLVLDEDWGSFRWMIWGLTIRSFADICSHDWMRLLFGVGPDSLPYIFVNGHMEEMLVAAEKVGYPGAMMQNAHNEWLTMFVNYGLFGGSAYLGIFVSAFVCGAKRIIRNVTGARVEVKNSVCDLRDELYFPVLVCASVFSYFAHDFVSYHILVGEPYIFVIMGVLGGVLRNRREQNG